MKQELHIIVITHVNLDKNPDQTKYEKALENKIKEAVKEAIGTRMHNTIVDIAFGDPV